MEPTTASASIFTLANAKWLLVAGIPLAVKVLWDYFSIKRDVKEVKKDNKEILSKLDRNSEEHKEVISRLDKLETIVDERTEKKV